MAGILTATAIGRVKDRPEVRQSQGGKFWLSAWLECPKTLRFGRRKGETINAGCRLKLFGDRAVTFAEGVGAGAILAVTGEPRADAYQPQAGGEPRATLEIHVETWAVISPGEGRARSERAPREGRAARDDARRTDGGFTQGHGSASDGETFEDVPF